MFETSFAGPVCSDRDGPMAERAAVRVPAADGGWFDRIPVTVNGYRNLIALVTL